MIDRIVVVLGGGSSDIGKGWLSASIASLLESPLPLKIDPFLNRSFPEDIGVQVDGATVSDDLATYAQLGLPVSPEQNLVMGELLSNFGAQSQGLEFERDGKKVVKKLTFADISKHIASRMEDLVGKHHDRRTLVVEVGGTVEDREHEWIPDAIRHLGRSLSIQPEFVLLGYLEPSEGTYRIKTQSIRKSIRTFRSRYHHSLAACFVRRRFVGVEFDKPHIEAELRNVAHETALDPAKIHFLENMQSPGEVRASIEDLAFLAGSASSGSVSESLAARPTTTHSDPNTGAVVCSACILGLACRYDGAPLPGGEKLLELLKGHSIHLVCPELLGDLPLPRPPAEIRGGDGEDVLDGRAKVFDKNGKDVTEQFLSGARKALDAILPVHPTKAILCDKSPACGSTLVFDGTFQGVKKPGKGVFAALLRRHGIEVEAWTPTPRS